MRMRRFLATAATLGLATFIATGCSLGGGIPSNAICKVDGEAVKTANFNELTGQAKRNYKNQGQKFPKKSSAEYKQLRNQAVDYLIEQELFRQRAEELDVKVKDKDVNERLKQLKESFFQGDKKKYKAELKKQGLTEKQVKENIRTQILTQKLFEKVTEDVKVSNAKAEKYFGENEAQYKTPASREVAHILVKDKKKADELYEQVKGGDKATFAKLAKKNSQDPSSAQNGGTLTANKGQLVPEFEKEAFRLEVGEVSKPIKTSFGYHIITARSETKPEKKQSFKEVKDQIKQTLEQEQRSKRMQEWRQDLRKDAEEKVECKKGYVWTQTVTTKSTKSSGPKTESEAEPKKDDKADAAKTTGDEDAPKDEPTPKDGK